MPALLFFKSPLFKYGMIVLLLLALVFSIYHAGASSVQAKWDAANIETDRVIAELKGKSEQITIKTEIQYVDRIKEIRIKGDKIVEKVTEYVTAVDDSRCVVNVGFGRVWDSAIDNEIPDAATEADARTSDITLSEVAENAATNFGICHQYIEQNRGLKQWIKEQAELNK